MVSTLCSLWKPVWLQTQCSVKYLSSMSPVTECDSYDSSCQIFRCLAMQCSSWHLSGPVAVLGKLIITCGSLLGRTLSWVILCPGSYIVLGHTLSWVVHCPGSVIVLGHTLSWPSSARPINTACKQSLRNAFQSQHCFTAACTVVPQNVGSYTKASVS